MVHHTPLATGLAAFPMVGLGFSAEKVKEPTLDEQRFHLVMPKIGDFMGVGFLCSVLTGFDGIIALAYLQKNVLVFAGN